MLDLVNNRNEQATQITAAQSGGGQLPTESDRIQSHAEDNFQTRLTPPDNTGDHVFDERNEALDIVGSTDHTVSGRLKINGGETSYVGSAHWASILDGITDLRRELDDVSENEDAEHGDWQHEEEITNAAMSTSHAHSLLHSPKRLTKVELLAEMPSRLVVDQLVATWFNSSDPFKQAIHKIQFEQEYRQFWKDPAKAPVMWISMLYSIMGLGCFFRIQTSRQYLSPEAYSIYVDADNYLDLAAAAAVLADYMTPKAYTIETLLLHADAWRFKASPHDLWLLMGVVVRLALRMGYHRDASHYGTLLSPYTGEMRRRMYAVLYMSDTLTSFQLGLPAMLRSVQSDTELPHNLKDQDFGVHDTSLPPSHPLETFTSAGYSAAKLLICRVFSDAAELSHATSPPSYEHVMKVDAQLEDARSRIPPPLRAKAIEMNLYDSPEVISCCVGLDILYHKTKCVLHRRFMTSTALNPAQEYSRRSCISAAMQILRYHRTMAAASQPGGRLESVAWYFETISKTDFLLAAMIICVELSQDSLGIPLASDSQDDTVASHQDMIEMVEATKDIWEAAIAKHKQAFVTNETIKRHLIQRSGVIQETIKACKAMTVMLRLVKDRSSGSRATGADGSSMPGVVPKVFPGDMQGMDLSGDLMTDDYSMIGSLMDSLNNADWVSDILATSHVRLLIKMLGDVESTAWG